MTHQNDDYYLTVERSVDWRDSECLHRLREWIGPLRISIAAGRHSYAQPRDEKLASLDDYYQWEVALCIEDRSRRMGWRFALPSEFGCPEYDHLFSAFEGLAPYAPQNEVQAMRQALRTAHAEGRFPPKEPRPSRPVVTDASDMVLVPWPLIQTAWDAVAHLLEKGNGYGLDHPCSHCQGKAAESGGGIDHEPTCAMVLVHVAFSHIAEDVRVTAAATSPQMAHLFGKQTEGGAR